MHHDHEILEARVRRELHERIEPAAELERIPLHVEAHHLDGEPVALAEVAGADFAPITAGSPWGPPWGTTWFRATGEVPDPVPGTDREVVVELGFAPTMAGFQAEGAVYVEGHIVCGVHPKRRAVPLDVVARDGRVDFLVEAAANPDLVSSFRPQPLGSLRTAGSDPLYVFGGIHILRFSPEVRRFATEARTMSGLMRTFPPGHRRRDRLALVLREAFDAIDLDDVRGTATHGLSVLARGWKATAAPAAHRVWAVGHAHIDTAWLWPVRETRRKCARTFANAVQLADEFEDFTFACSQAAQYDWVEQDHPELFERMRRKVAEGRWVPVGGMWVEADMNLPSGESLARQLVHGQRWFESRFGRRCGEVWIPDVFGYPGSLPQVFVAGGCRRFLTQKLSWNKQNRFPHHTFLWEGIDGSTVLAHFPPVDTYNAEITPTELAHSEANFSDHGWSDHSLMPFGHGDGGGGPTREMMWRAGLLADVEGLPRLAVGSPSEFFDNVEAEIAAGAPVPRWRGELYFEMHRGTFTSQARTKVGNRRCENALREAELWLATLGDTSHAEATDELWKRVLLQQFHDILPGSSIAWVHEDAEAEHADVLARLDALVTECLQQLSGGEPSVANPATHDRDEVAVAPDPPPGDGTVQELSDGGHAFRCRARGLGLSPAVAEAVDDRVEVTGSAERATLRNGSVEVVVAGGRVASFTDRRHGRQVLAPDKDGRTASAGLTIAPDHPVEFDAWDLEQWTAGLAAPLAAPVSSVVLDRGPLVGSVRTEHRLGATTITQTFRLRAGSPRLDIHLAVDWHERESLLALEVPLDVRTDSAACEIQFGAEMRPTHASTSWDAAKFEVCAQRWVDLSEADFGVAVLNDGRHGHAVQGLSDGSPGIRVSVLRGAGYPDPGADLGHHEVTIAVLPHGPGLAEVPAEAEALNLPLRHVPGGGGVGRATPPQPLVRVPDPRIQVSAVKLADDGGGDLVVRLWEATGATVATELAVTPGAREVWGCNLLEEPWDRPDLAPPELDRATGRVRLRLRPFQMATLRIRPAHSAG